MTLNLKIRNQHAGVQKQVYLPFRVLLGCLVERAERVGPVTALRYNHMLEMRKRHSSEPCPGFLDRSSNSRLCEVSYQWTAKELGSARLKLAFVGLADDYLLIIEEQPHHV